MIVFLPVSHHEAQALRAGDDLGTRPGCAVTGSLRDALGDETSTEEADYAALHNAGALAVGLTSEPRRLVLALVVRQSQVADQQTGEGAVAVTGARWSQVQSLFADEPAAREAVATARQSTGARVREVLDPYDFLWFGPEELDTLG